MVTRALQLITLVLALCLLAVPSAGAQAQPDATPGTDPGWRFERIEVSPDQLAVGDVAVARFDVVTGNDVPVGGLLVSASLRAPTTTSSKDPPGPILTTVGIPQSEPGSYQVSVALNQPGRWWLDIRVTGGSQTASTSQFLTVAPSSGVPPATTDQPVFLPGDTWGAYYRLDPNTGSLATLDGQSLLHARDHWWLAQTHLAPVGPVSAQYGGTWRLTIDLNDGLTGKPVRTIDLGDIRASVYVGSSDQPAIATSLALSPDGSRLYAYWARQLGQGWLARLAALDAATGQLLDQRQITGAISADAFWGQLSVTGDGSELVLAEQAVRAAGVSGYRLTVLSADTLDITAEHRRTVAPDDPLTACILAYPGPTGAVAGPEPLRYSLCSPSGVPGELALLVWDPVSGIPVHQVNLSNLAGVNPYDVYGVAAPDGQHFYVVNTAAQRIAEVDMEHGMILRQASFAGPSNAPSTWDRLFNWILGAVAPPASAGVLLQAGVSIAPDGKALYLVAPGSDRDTAGDGVLVINTDTLQVSSHLLVGQPVTGVMVGPAGRLVVRQVTGRAGDEISILDPDGQTVVSLAVPGHPGGASDTH